MTTEHTEEHHGSDIGHAIALAAVCGVLCGGLLLIGIFCEGHSEPSEFDYFRSAVEDFHR